MNRFYFQAGITVLVLGFWMVDCQAQSSRSQSSRGQISRGQCSRGQSSRGPNSDTLNTGPLGPSNQYFNGLTGNALTSYQSPYGNLFQQQSMLVQRQALAMRQQSYQRQLARSGQNQQALIAMRRQRADQKRLERAERIAARIADNEYATAVANRNRPTSTLLVSTDR